MKASDGIEGDIGETGGEVKFGLLFQINPAKNVADRERIGIFSL